jgi:hypothetical protein
MKIFLLFSVLCINPIFASEANWVKTSDKIAEDYTKAIGNIYPEDASSMGYSEYDTKVMHLTTELQAQEDKLNNEWVKLIDEKILSEKDPNVLIDLKILKDKLLINLESSKITDQIGEIPYYSASKWVFNQLQSLINPQSSPERKKNAVDRFKKYVNGDNSMPLIPSYEVMIKAKEEKYKNSPKFYTLKNEMELYLTESSDYLKGIEELLSQTGRNDWKDDFKKFGEQLKVYDNFINDDQLKKARTDYKLPRPIYQFILKMRGIDSSPEYLIKTARKDYKKLYLNFKSVAKEIAQKHSLKATDPISVINFLKTKQITSAADAEKVYKEADTFISNIILENKIVSLPKAPLIIRIAGDAESKAAPVPHMTPPPLINNKGERPEFIVPSSSTGKLPFDDFSYKEAAYILVAHEGRPGHDLQFSSMLDNGVSIIRSRFAFNNVNVEGWALYSEDLLYSYLPLEAKLPALQMRLWRMARMFLDPEVQTGKAHKNDVIKVFTKELGVSPVMANLEYNRYTFQDPGQAPAYYYGLIKLREAKDKVKKKLGNSFTEICFNDAVLALGLLPIKIIQEELLQNLKCN